MHYLVIENYTTKLNYYLMMISRTLLCISVSILLFFSNA